MVPSVPTVAVPSPGWAVMVSTWIASPSGSESFDRTGMSIAWPETVRATSGRATGGG